jgi:hypothetical protein
VQNAEWSYTKSIPIMAAVGANGDFEERAIALVHAGANIILIDVAHGHHENVKQSIATLKKVLSAHVDFIAGNIASAQAAKDLEAWQADGWWRFIVYHSFKNRLWCTQCFLLTRNCCCNNITCNSRWWY